MLVEAIENASILVVEDNPDLNAAICEILESYGYQVSSAVSGLDALPVIHESQPDVILCDIVMPDMDGYTLLKHTRADPQLRTMPFIFLTARTSHEDRRLARETGIDDYLTKPVDEEDLVITINNALRRQKDMIAEMERQMDILRSQIVGTLQHEFRTPLTFVLGYAQYLNDLIDQDISIDDLRTSIAGILEGGYRLQRLIESFLLLAEVQNRKMQPEELESLLAWPLLKNAALDMNAELEKAELSVDIKIQNQDALLLGEPELLHEALKRFVDNAIQYRRPESKKIYLSVEKVSDTHVGLRVQDEGVGISPETVELLSRPFEQGVRDDRTQPGAGLSLALVHHIASLHGGRVQIESTEGEGSTFTLWVNAGLEF